MNNHKNLKNGGVDTCHRVKVAYFVKKYGRFMTYLNDEIKNLKVFEPIMLTETTGELTLLPTGLRIYSELGFFRGKSKYWFRSKFFRDILMRNRVGLIRACFGYGGLKMLPLCQQLKLPLITSFHGIDVSERAKRRIYRYRLKKLFEKGSLFLVRSEVMKEDTSNLGCEGDKIVVHYGGVDVEKFRFKKRRETQGKVKILMCGRFIEKKGFEYGIMAFAQLLKKYNDIELRIIGDGYMQRKLKMLVKRLGAHKNLIFLGVKNHSEVAKEMRDADIFLSPNVTSRNGDREGIPNTIKEAMATGLPVVSTYHSGIPELVIDKKTGFLVPEKDVDGLVNRLDYLIAHPEIWDDLGREGRKVVEEKFNLFKQVRRLEAIYQSLIDNHFR